MKYLVYQWEKCPNTGKRHAQGYVVFKRSIKLRPAQRLIHPEICMHMETPNGTHEQNRSYCTKEESRIEGPFEFGELPVSQQGKRTDLDDAISDFMNPKLPLTQVIKKHANAYVRYHKGFEKLRDRVDFEEVPKFRKLEVTVLFGVAGCGKSRWASNSESVFMLNKQNGSTWWNYYDGEDTLIIDDFYGWLPYAEMLKTIDGYKQPLGTKGSFTVARWTKVFITSNVHPREWYSALAEKHTVWSDDPDVEAGLSRRVHFIFECSTNMFGHTFHCVKGGKPDLKFDKNYNLIE